MATHDRNGSRNYLADEVKELRARVESEVKELRAKVDVLNDTVIRDSVSLATLLEEGVRARAYREKMDQKVDAVHQKVDAGRAENTQTAMSITAIQTGMEKIARVQAEQAEAFTLAKGGLMLAKASGRLAWWLLGVVIAGVAAGYAWLIKSLPVTLPPPGPPHP